jgi:hypothetical protein
VIEHAEFYEWLAAERRVLRSYKGDKQVFLMEAAPPGSVPVAQRGLHRYLRDNAPPRIAGQGQSGEGLAPAGSGAAAGGGQWGVDVSE